MICEECKKRKKTVACEIHNPKGARICKDCCINKMGGPACKWYELCW